MLKRLATALAVAALVVSVVAVPSASGAADNHQVVSIDASIGRAETINLAGGGLVPVSILGGNVDVRTVVIDQLMLDGVGVARWDDGGAIAAISDVDGDGHDDLTAHFAKEHLLESGLDAATQSMTLIGGFADGAEFEASDDIATDVVLEIKFDDGLRVRGTERSLRSLEGESLAPVESFLAEQDNSELVPSSTGQRRCGLTPSSPTSRRRPVTPCRI